MPIKDKVIKKQSSLKILNNSSLCLFNKHYIELSSKEETQLMKHINRACKKKIKLHSLYRKLTNIYSKNIIKDIQKTRKRKSRKIKL